MPERPGLAWLSVSAVVIAADQATKWIAETSLTYAVEVPVFPGLNWKLLYNLGAAFSFLSDQGGWQRWFFSILALVISGVLSVWLYRTERSDWPTALPLALIIGGAVGNLVDRLRLGHVVDFIDVYYRDYHWPAFNVADSSIFVGAALLILFGFKETDRKGGSAAS